MDRSLIGGVPLREKLQGVGAHIVQVSGIPYCQSLTGFDGLGGYVNGIDLSAGLRGIPAPGDGAPAIAGTGARAIVPDRAGFHNTSRAGMQLMQPLQRRKQRLAATKSRGLVPVENGIQSEHDKLPPCGSAIYNTVAADYIRGGLSYGGVPTSSRTVKPFSSTGETASRPYRAMAASQTSVSGKALESLIWTWPVALALMRTQRGRSLRRDLRGNQAFLRCRLSWKNTP